MNLERLLLATNSRRDWRRTVRESKAT